MEFKQTKDIQTARRQVKIQIRPCTATDCEKCELSQRLFDRACENISLQEDQRSGQLNEPEGEVKEDSDTEISISGEVGPSRKIDTQSSQEVDENLSQGSQEEVMLKRYRKPAQKAVLQNLEDSQTSSNSQAAASQAQKVTNPNVIKYSVLWAKVSTRKHKKWEGDGFLLISGTSLILKNDAEKTIDSCQNLKLPELESGLILRVGSREVELQDLCESTNEMSCENAPNLRAAITDGSVSEVIPNLPEQKVSSFSNPLSRKPFVLPCQAGSYEPVDRGNRNVAKPLFDPNALDALVLPDPSEEHQRLFNADNLPLVPVVVDPHVARHLRPHQREGVTFLYKATYLPTQSPTGAILADDMGLGKTLQCISLLWTLHRQGPYGRKKICDRTLIVTPSSLVNNWEKEFLRWLGNERMQVFVVSSQKPVEKCPGTIPVIIISYEMAIRSEKVLKSKKFDLMICDEAHKIKNRKNQAYQLLEGLNCPRKILLTGTPIQNDLMELYALIDLIRPGVLGSESEFRSEFVAPIEKCRDTHEESNSAIRAATELNTRISHFFLRRDSAVMLQYLPNRVTQVVFCQPSSLQKQIYEAISSSGEAEKIISGTGASQSPLSLILLLKKLCNHPNLVHPKANSDKNDLHMDIGGCFPSNYNHKHIRPEDSGKLLVLLQMLQAFHSDGRKVVVVSHYTQTLTIIEEVCNNRGFPLLRLDGSVVSKDRMSIVTKFNSKDDPYVFLLSSKAGGVGLNLQSSSKIILYDIDWNPAHDAQAMARCWRPGQKHETFIYRLLTSGTIEERIYQRQISKQTMSGSVVDLLQSDSPSFSKEELRDIFTFYDNGCVTHQLLGCECHGDGLNTLDPGFSRGDDMEPPLKKSKTGKTNRMGELLQWEHFGQDQFAYCEIDPVVNHPKVDFVFRNKSANNEPEIQSEDERENSFE